MQNKDKTPFSQDPAQDPACLRKRIVELEKKLTEQKKIEEKLRELPELQHDISERKNNEKILRKQIELIKLISGISTDFVRAAADEIDREIKTSLRKIGEFAGVDHSYVFLYTEDGRLMENRYEWCAEGVSSHTDHLRDIPSETFPWLMSMIENGETVSICDVSQMPEEAASEKLEFQSKSIRSVLIFPFYIRGVFSGFTGFDHVRRAANWNESDLSLMHMFSDVISSALERRRLDAALNESEAKSHSITESAMDAIIMTDNDGEIIYWNPAAENIFGYTVSEVIGREVHSFLAPKEYYAAFKKAYECFKTTGKGSAIGKTFEFRALKKDGTEILVEISLSGFRLKGLWHASAIIRDISDRRAMEESLLEEKRFAESLIENSTVATFVLDRSHKIVFWNKACEELTGITSADITGTSDHWKPFYDYKRPTIADVILDGNIDIIPSLYKKYSISALRPDGIQGEGWFERLNNRRRYILFEAAPVFNSRGELIFAIETLQDITWRKEAQEELEKYRGQLEKLVVERTSELLKVNMELERDIRNRKQAEEALRLSEARFEEAQRVARIGTWEWNIATGDVYWSNEVYRIFGLAPHEIVPSRWSFLNYVHPDDRENVKQAVAGALEDNRQYSIDIRVVCPDGTVSIVQTQGKAYHDRTGKPVMMLGNVQDITERKKMGEEILKIHKLESIGILAGGIAHDFNNLLSAILGNISLARLNVEPGGAIHERLEEAGKAASRAIKLSTQLLTYSKGGVPVKKATSAASLVREAIDFTLRGSNVKGEVLFPDNLWLVEADEDQIFQVINNIAINAKQAMPAGGTITVLGENITNEGCILPLAEGKYVKISIKDQGAGIPYEHRGKIFDPFFTTKEKGSGLGLATSYSIMKKHDGYLALETGEGRGTTFHIYLPATEKGLQSSKQKAALLEGKGRLLVMDDEEIIRVVVGKMLEEIGYEADFAENGEEAIELYEEAMKSGAPFSAVIMDLTVRGGMGGLECMKSLLEIDPEVKAIVSSGYADNPIMSKYRESGFKGIIIKPYEIEDLSEILYKIINDNSRVDCAKERTL